jgi:hypothetical protein
MSMLPGRGRLAVLGEARREATEMTEEVLKQGEK